MPFLPISSLTTAMIRLLHHCRPRDRGIVARALPRFLIDCQTQTQTDNQTAVSPPTLASCIINHRQGKQAILLFRNISTDVEHAHPVDCLTATLDSHEEDDGSALARGYSGQHGSRARSHAFLKAGRRLTATRVRACIAADPALTKEGNVSQRVSRRASTHNCRNE